VKVRLFVGTNFRGFCKMHCLVEFWIRCFKHNNNELASSITL